MAAVFNSPVRGHGAYQSPGIHDRTLAIKYEATAEHERRIWRALYPDACPNRTAFERQLAWLVALHEASGLDGIRAWLREDPAYRKVCGGRA
jgi:hypothetical protein